LYAVLAKEFGNEINVCKKNEFVPHIGVGYFQGNSHKFKATYVYFFSLSLFFIHHFVDVADS
jgi:hypothetical protein